MEKIIVFGATGDLGLYFCDYCKNIAGDKYEIIAVGRRKTDLFKKQGIKYFEIDITNKDDLAKLPTENIRTIVDFAAVMPAHMKGYDPYKYFEVNTIGTLNLLEFARINKVKQFVFTQTISDILGHLKHTKELTWDMPKNMSFNDDHTVYAISKNAALDLLENYHQQYGLKTFVFRLPNIYMYTPDKTYQVDGKPKTVAYRYMIDKAIKGEDLELWGDPNAARDIVYVKDCCQMIYKAIISDLDKGFYNVGTGVTTTLEDQIRGIIEVFSPDPKKTKIIYKPDKGDALSYRMVIDNAVSELGYEPEYYYLDYLKDYKKEMTLNKFEEMY